MFIYIYIYIYIYYTYILYAEHSVDQPPSDDLASSTVSCK